MVVLDLLDFLEVVIAKVQKIHNKLCALSSRILQNLVSNINSSQVLSWPKPTHFAFSPSDVFSYPSNVTQVTSPTLLGGDPIDLGIRQACGLLISVECLQQINNNFCMYYRDTNYYVSNCPKAN